MHGSLRGLQLLRSHRRPHLHGVLSDAVLKFSYGAKTSDALADATTHTTERGSTHNRKAPEGSEFQLASSTHPQKQSAGTPVCSPVINFFAKNSLSNPVK